MFWIWGDTNRAGYPLGNFHGTGATSPLLRQGSGFEVEKDVPLDYFLEADSVPAFVKGMAPMPGEGPTWLSGLTTLTDKDGGEHLVASNVKVKPPMTVYRRAFCEFDSGAEIFRHVADFDEPLEKEKSAVSKFPEGHSFPFTDAEDRDWIYYADPLPALRHPARYEAWLDNSTHETLTSDADFSDAASGKKITPNRGSISWNPHRGRWVMIFTEQGGDSSYLGEIWYAEADSPTGPWRRCVKVLSHDRYSFYNPLQHPELSTDGGRVIYFEGTYTTLFSKTAHENRTPLYDYNQILYRLVLDDPRLGSALAN